MLPDEDGGDPGRRHVGGGAVGGGLSGPGGGDALRRHRGARQGHDGGVEGAAGAAAHVCGRGQSRRICQDSRTFQINFLCQMFCIVVTLLLTKILHFTLLRCSNNAKLRS